MAPSGTTPTARPSARPCSTRSRSGRPNIRKLIIDKQVLSPNDIEERIGLSEGNIFQGELSLEQLFFNRPVPGWARYRTPVGGSGCAARPRTPAAA